MKIDAHQHFWKYDPQQYPWIPRGSALHRDFLPDDLAPLLQQHGLDGSIAVQARQSLEETRWLLDLAKSSAHIKGVVGWVNLRSERVEEELNEFASNPKFVGVRHVVQDEPDVAFMVRPEFTRGIRKLAPFDLTYDLLIYPSQLDAAIELVADYPEQLFVLDHIAKPSIKNGGSDGWAAKLRTLAKAGPCFCKLSGMITEADHQNWTADQITPYLDIAFEAFGADRVMFGSDWPVCLLAGSYSQVHDIVRNYISANAPTAMDAVPGGNAADIYEIE